MRARHSEIPPNINGVLFDVDGTLYYQTPIRVIMIYLLIWSNLFKPKELIKKIRVISEYRKAQEALRNSDQMMPECRQLQIQLASRNSNESKIYVSEVIQEWIERRPLPFLRFCRRRGLNTILNFLDQQGFKLGVFSDYPPESKLDALGVRHYFSTIVSVDDPEVKGFKPVTNGFATAARKMGFDSSRILYIGDRYRVDGTGASSANMPVIILGGFCKRRKTRDYLCVNSFYEIIRLLAQSRVGTSQK